MIGGFLLAYPRGRRDARDRRSRWNCRRNLTGYDRLTRHNGLPRDGGLHNRLRCDCGLRGISRRNFGRQFGAPAGPANASEREADAEKR